MDYLWAFLVGGGICAAGQLLIDKTRLTPARILTGFVCLGIFLSFLGVYDYLVDFAGAGAMVPITGFGHNLFKGVKAAVDENGLFGVLTGPLTAASGGLCAVIIFALIAAAFSKPSMKR